MKLPLRGILLRSFTSEGSYRGAETSPGVGDLLSCSADMDVEGKSEKNPSRDDKNSVGISNPVERGDISMLM